MMSFDVIKKAILLESNYMMGHQKGGTEVKPDTMREVVSFYIQLRETFQFELSYEDLTDNMHYDERVDFEKEMIDWSKENGILMFRDRPAKINYFTTEEDASAFKLRWF